jgi:hypothetical protein
MNAAHLNTHAQGRAVPRRNSSEIAAATLCREKDSQAADLKGPLFTEAFCCAAITRNRQVIERSGNVSIRMVLTSQAGGEDRATQ